MVFLALCIHRYLLMVVFVKYDAGIRGCVKENKHRSCGLSLYRTIQYETFFFNILKIVIFICVILQRIPMHVEILHCLFFVTNNNNCNIKIVSVKHIHI